MRNHQFNCFSVLVFLLCYIVSTSTLAATLFAQDAPTQKKNSSDNSAGQSESDDANALDEVSGEVPISIEKSDFESKEWESAIADAKAHQNGQSYYTLFRVIMKDDDDAGDDDEIKREEIREEDDRDVVRRSKIQLQGLKLKELTRKYSGGGGKYREETSGAFVLLEHIDSSIRKEGKSPLIVAAATTGTKTLWLNVPKRGELSILGDIVISNSPMEQCGELCVKILPNRIKAGKHIQVGPIVVGGPYGIVAPLDDGKCVISRLAKGTHRLVLPDFDSAKSRWEVNIKPRKTTTLEFAVRSDNKIHLVKESFKDLEEKE